MYGTHATLEAAQREAASLKDKVTRIIAYGNWRYQVIVVADKASDRGDAPDYEAVPEVIAFDLTPAEVANLECRTGTVRRERASRNVR
jgi:hypothetical protein